jgi:hypothetical protein
MPVVMDYKERLSKDVDGVSEVVRRVYIGKGDYEVLLAYCKRSRVRRVDMWRRVVSDWRRLLQESGDTEAYFGFMWTNWMDRRRDGGTDVVAIEMYLKDYVFVLDIGRRFFGSLARFFPLMVNEWLTKYGQDLASEAVELGKSGEVGQRGRSKKK